MNIDEKFDLIFNVGSAVCAAYTGFSKTEVAYCQQKSNWLQLYDFLMSSDPYEALIHFSLRPIADVVGYFQLFIGCMMQFPDEQHNERLENLLEIVDHHDEFDDALRNTRMIRALLALNVKYAKSYPHKCFWLFYNSKRVLAHVFKKFPSYLDMNVLKSSSKKRSLRFRKEEIDIFQ